MTEYICENADVFFDSETMPSGGKVVQRMTIDIKVKQEIVRCRDCKHSDRAYWCKHFGSYGDLPPVTPDGFCAWGEREDTCTVSVQR